MPLLCSIEPAWLWSGEAAPRYAGYHWDGPKGHAVVMRGAAAGGSAPRPPGFSKAWLGCPKDCQSSPRRPSWTTSGVSPLVRTIGRWQRRETTAPIRFSTSRQTPGHHTSAHTFGHRSKCLQNPGGLGAEPPAVDDCRNRRTDNPVRRFLGTDKIVRPTTAIASPVPRRRIHRHRISDSLRQVDAPSSAYPPERPTPRAAQAFSPLWAAPDGRPRN